ncbi:hypothetical protein O3M35_009489 [Rhynocoris fuscipes]|uniref:Uncharacterized protein n=1 Tax=Rhynocoris fuscipes TaxID=488301 RepID=A0AAW1D3W4_9HEMI
MSVLTTEVRRFISGVMSDLKSERKEVRREVRSVAIGEEGVKDDGQGADGPAAPAGDDAKEDVLTGFRGWFLEGTGAGSSGKAFPDPPLVQ